VLEQEAMEEEEEDKPWPCLKVRVIKAGEREEDAKFLVTKQSQGAKLAGALVATKREEREDMVAPIYVGTVWHVDGDNRTVRVNREVVRLWDKPYRGVAPMSRPQGADSWVYGFYKVDELVELERKSLQELEAAGVTGGCACPVQPYECYACVLACKNVDVEESVDVEEGGEGEASSSKT
jgi:hypothetical protein